MVTAQIPGLPSYHAEVRADMPALIELLAQGLRQIHALPFDDCPLDSRIETVCQRVEKWFEDGVMTLDDLPDQLRMESLTESLRNVRSRQPEKEDLVFTHGDYCMPNILVEHGRITGFIDLGYAGIGDRYWDFISADYSIRRNFGGEWIQPFWDAYGVEIDPAKFDFYQQLHWIL